MGGTCQDLVSKPRGVAPAAVQGLEQLLMQLLAASLASAPLLTLQARAMDAACPLAAAVPAAAVSIIQKVQSRVCWSLLECVGRWWRLSACGQISEGSLGVDAAACPIAASSINQHAGLSTAVISLNGALHPPKYGISKQ